MAARQRRHPGRHVRHLHDAGHDAGGLGSTYRARVTNTVASTLSSSATLTVTSAGGSGGGDDDGAPRRRLVGCELHYRVGLTASVASAVATDKPAQTALDLAALLAQAGGTGTPDPASLRVVEIDDTGTVVDAAVPFQFDPDTAGATRGTLTWLLAGTTPASSTRLYHVYFDTTGTGHTAAAVSSRVTLADNVTDAGQAAYRITTPTATWYYQKAAGGFSSLVDPAGNDWISYTPTPGSGASGEYRGIPNAVYPEGSFYPGATNATSRLLAQGPLKISIQSTTTDNAWQQRWDIYPGYATMTMTRAAHDWWFLYEGTPGGTIDAGDTVLRSGGTTSALATSWTGDLPAPEWVAFSDPAAGRSLFAAHHADDTAIDSYRLMNNAMTVFGFGRNNLTSLLTGQQTITVGLTDTTTFATVDPQVRGAMASVVTALAAAQAATTGANVPPTVNAGRTRPRRPGSRRPWPARCPTTGCPTRPPHSRWAGPRPRARAPPPSPTPPPRPAP